MMIQTSSLEEETKGICDIINLTPKVEERLERENVQRGWVSLFVSGSTAALTTIEYEPGLIQDLKELMEKLIPSNREYQHDKRWGDNNGFSHLRAALLGPSLQIPVEGGRLSLGTWQQIVLLDFDNRPRRRQILVQIMGEIA